MRSKKVVGGIGILLAGATGALAQGRGGTDWSTSGGDAQRSGWVRTDAKISPESLAKPGFQFMWKLKLNNAPKQGNGLSAPVVMDRYIGYRGFRSYVFVGGSSDNVFAFDSDLYKVEWQKHLSGAAAGQGTAACPGGMTTAVTRPVGTAFPSANVGGGGGGARGGPAKSGVGEPMEGAVTLQALAAQQQQQQGPGRQGGAAGRGPGAPAAAPGGGRGRMPSYLHMVSSDGAFHSMYISNGEEPKPAVKFLPANANAVGLTMIDTTAYAATINNCGGAANGVWALDTTNGSVASWKGNVAGSEGFAFGPDGSVIAATAEGQVAVLEAKTLAAKGSYSAGGALTSTPVLFENKGKAMIAVGAKDGSIHVIDSASLGAAAAKSAAAGGSVESLATFADGRGGRYLLAARGKTITAHKVVEQGGSLVIQDAWTSKEIPNVLTPLVFSGVAFALAGGDAKSPAKLYALEAATGKELWNSGSTITSFVPKTGGMTAGGSAVYLGTHDGTVWAFGIPIEH